MDINIRQHIINNFKDDNVEVIKSKSLAKQPHQPIITTDILRKFVFTLHDESHPQIYAKVTRLLSSFKSIISKKFWRLHQDSKIAK